MGPLQCLLWNWYNLQEAQHQPECRALAEMMSKKLLKEYRNVQNTSEIIRIQNASRLPIGVSNMCSPHAVMNLA
jgi:hypothetical protein